VDGEICGWSLIPEVIVPDKVDLIKYCPDFLTHKEGAKDTEG
jgi:hypothetical protein